MMTIILNEQEWIEAAVRNLDLGDNSWRTVNCYAKYLHEQGYKKSDMRREIEDFIIRCDPSANLLAWQSVIDNAVKNADSRPLVCIDGVTVSKSEMERIDQLHSQMMRRLMFTLVCLAKYKNCVRGDSSNWVSMPIGDIFSLANVKTTRKWQALLLNDLYQCGYIGLSRTVDNMSINVKIVDETSEQEMFVNDFRCLGNQYMMSRKGGYIRCEECGVVVKRTGRRQKYCKDCAKVVNSQNTMFNRSSVA